MPGGAKNNDRKKTGFFTPGFKDSYPFGISAITSIGFFQDDKNRLNSLPFE
jgi:hypothetical protein